MEFLTIGQVARRFRITLQTLYHYERLGLVAPNRQDGQRSFDAACLEQLQFVLERKRDGLTLAEISALLNDARARAIDVVLVADASDLPAPDHSMRTAPDAEQPGRDMPPG